MSTLPSRILFTLNALITSLGAYIADWNKTHIYNPRWPPHAKFHNGQTMSMGLALGLCTLYYTWSVSPQTAEGEKMRRGFIVVLASLYWVTQASGLLYPGSEAVDPEFEGDFWHAQAIPISICLSLLGIGLWLDQSAGQGKGQRQRQKR
ncbi:MAG: hypothetical protein Q9160_004379 [Pyrenula sp. 1 TL-2023]